LPGKEKVKIKKEVRMIPVEEAQRILKETPVFPATEEVPCGDCLGRVLAEDIFSTLDMPPFNKAAMDGYAIHSEDSSKKFKIVETIPAGYRPQKEIRFGECAKIMTGGMVPRGANRVVKREVTVEQDGWMKIVGEDPNPNLCFQGEDLRQGDLVLSRGTLIRPQEVAVLASMGLERVKVYCRPQVGILATGSELVPPGKPRSEEQIYDSNSFSLAAQVRQLGVVVKKLSRVADDQDLLRFELAELLSISDVLLISGGVSAGDYDYVPTILQELGVKIHFHKLAIKPGKPTAFGTKGEKVIFGVPGNPVSTFVIFELFIKPFLWRMMGHDYRPLLLPGELTQELTRKKAAREAWVPVRYQEGKVFPLPYHGSAHIHALTQANGLISFPRGEKIIRQGTQVVVRPI